MKLPICTYHYTLLRTSQAGKVECVQMLLDRSAQVDMQDKVWVVIIHCVHAMQHVPRGLSSAVCKNPV